MPNSNIKRNVVFVVYTTRVEVLKDRRCSNLPVIDEAINSLLSQLPSDLVLVVVLSPAEHHQAFRLGIFNVGQVF